jgi:hypothetical protein
MKRFAIAMIILLTILLRTSFGQDSSDVFMKGRYDLDRWGGSNDFCFYEDYLLITGEDNFLTIFDVSDPENLREATRYRSGFDWRYSFTEISVFANYAYINSRAGKCYIVDLSDILNPQLTDTLENCSMSASMGDEIGIGRSENNLILLDFSRPGRPEVLDQMVISGNIHQILEKDNYLYVRIHGRESCIQVWDFSNFNDPILDASIEGRFEYFEMDGNLLVASDADSYYVYDITEPQNPRRLSMRPGYESCRWNWCYFMQDSSVYMMAVTRDQYVENQWCINKTDLSNPRNLETTTIFTESFPYDAFHRFQARNGLGVLSKYGGSIEFLDCNDMDNVQSISSFNRHDDIGEMAITNNFTISKPIYRSGLRIHRNENHIPNNETGYISQYLDAIVSVEDDDVITFKTEIGELNYWNMSEDYQLEAVSSLAIWERYCNGMTVSNDLLYANSNRGFVIVDISDPEDMAIIARWAQDRYRIESIFLDEEKVYMFSGLNIIIVDISDPTEPFLVTDFRIDQFINDLVYVNGIVYLITRDNRMPAWDVSDPENPVRLGIIQSRGQIVNDQLSMRDIEIDETGEFLYMADGVAGLRIFDIGTNPGQPQEVGCYNMPKNAVKVFPKDGLVYVAEETGIGVYDVSVALGIKQEFLFPGEFGISAYPNPFNSQLNLTYNILRPGDVNLSIYDPAGRMVTTLTQVWQNAGQSQVIWDAGGMSSGNYLIKAVIGDRVEYRKVTLVR